MIDGFLGFRYQGVRRIDEILAKPADFGWKCRKYIKWREVHNTSADARALYAFAEALIENDKLLIELYGMVSAVWLNVQRWRLDKEHLAADPPPRREWASRDILFKAAQSNPGLIRAHLADQRLNLDSADSLGSQLIFYLREIDALLRAQRISGYPKEALSKDLLERSGRLSAGLLRRLHLAYTSVGGSLPEAIEGWDLVLQVLKDLGFEGIALKESLPVSTGYPAGEVATVVELGRLPKYALMEVTFVQGIVRLTLNEHHPYLRSVLVNGRVPASLELFFKGYARCLSNMAGASDTLEAFTALLGSELHSLAKDESSSAQ